MDLGFKSLKKYIYIYSFVAIQFLFRSSCGRERERERQHERKMKRHFVWLTLCILVRLLAPEVADVVYFTDEYISAAIVE